MTDRPLLVVFVGVPGSGKTTFARQLAVKLRAVVLNSDALRVSMWGSLENLRQARTTSDDKQQVNKLTFGAMNYAAEQIVRSGCSVIYDCNANRVSERQEKHVIAAESGALSIVVRIRVPYEVSLRRIQDRPATVDQRQIPADWSEQFLERFIHELEEPTVDERLIEIDGQASFDEQFQEFERRLSALLSDA